MQRKILSVFLLLATIAIKSYAIDPTATKYSNEECRGSLNPYTVPTQVYEYPDSLSPIMINHVGRHGSRFPASATHSVTMKRALLHADSIGSITPLGKELLAIVNLVIEKSNSRWGALDSLGEAEQRGIAARMYANYPTLFNEKNINAVSSYSPRCIMSMNSFVHQLSRMNNKVNISTKSGRNCSSLMRPFDIDEEYKTFLADKTWEPPYKEYMETTISETALKRILGEEYPYSNINVKELALVQYYVIAGLAAMEIDCDASKFFTTEEYNALWSCFNLRQYLQRTATTLSTTPAEIASFLLLDLIETTDKKIEGESSFTVNLRFGHAETLMPLLSLMHLKGCFYATNYFDTVALHWKDFYVVPMSSNLQMILFKTKKGKYYVRFDLNEKPISLIPNNDNIYIEWDKAREYMMHCIPMYLQP